jgi:hypothetical protein
MYTPELLPITDPEEIEFAKNCGYTAYKKPFSFGPDKPRSKKERNAGKRFHKRCARNGVTNAHPIKSRKQREQECIVP